MEKERDWTANRHSAFSTLGASNLSLHDRQERDFYATSPEATKFLLDNESFSKRIWEPAAGQGHMSDVLIKHGYYVRATDLYDYGRVYVASGIDFLSVEPPVEKWFDIITNPPFKYATQFVRKAMVLLQEGHKLALLLRILFLESAERHELFKEYPFCRMLVPARRLRCAMNGDFEKYKDSNAMAYAWYIWQKGYKGESVVKFIDNRGDKA